MGTSKQTDFLSYFFALLILWTLTAVAAGPRKLVVFVHGYTGDELIDKGRLHAKNRDELAKAYYGDYASIATVFQKYIDNSSVGDVDFFTFKYATFSHSNVESGRVLNLALKGEVQTETLFPNTFLAHNSLPVGRSLKDYSKVYILTLSNGNLVAREAILEAYGMKDDKASGGHLNYKKLLARRVKGTSVPNNFSEIKADKDLQDFYAHSSVYDMSPILAGAADARGAMGFPRHMEVDPFGPHNEWLFGRQGIDQYDEAIGHRHFTFFVVGDHHTRGLWRYWCKPSFSALDILNWAGSLSHFESWPASNRKWFAHFERARGADPLHHVEFVQTFPADSTCGLREYMQGNRLFHRDATVGEQMMQDLAADPKVVERLAQRRDQPNDYFMQLMSSDPHEYFSQDMIMIHGGDSYSKKIQADFYHPDGTLKSSDEVVLSERHSVLVFYKPLIKRLGGDVFGEDFASWFDKNYESAEASPSL